MVFRLEDVLDEANRRWVSLGNAQPLLASAIALQRQFLHESIVILHRLEKVPELLPDIAESTLAEKLGRGVPILRGEHLGVPVAALAPSLDRFCEFLADSSAGEAATHLLDAFQSGRINRASLLKASIGRNQRAIRSGADQMGVSPDLVWLVGELATAPLAHVLRDRLFTPRQSPTLQEALDRWDRGFCPACGSWPAFVEHLDGARTPRCSYCAAAWRLHSACCVYCGARDANFRMITPAPETPCYMLELCESCGGYMKGVKVTESTPFVLLPIADLETFMLDQKAAERGYGRPPMVEIAPAPSELPGPCNNDNE